MTSLFDTIADETRRKLLEALRRALDLETELSVGDLVEELGVSQPTVSKHLKVLRDNDLVSVRLDGQRRYYSLRPETLDPVVEWIESIRGAQPNVIAEVTEAPEQSADFAETVYIPIVPRNNALNRAGARLGETVAEFKVRGTEAIDAVESGTTKGVDGIRTSVRIVSGTVNERVIRPIMKAFTRER